MRPKRSGGDGSARDYALRLLAARAHTTAELARKLARRGYPGDEAAAVLAWLQGQGWLDDAAYARQYVAARSQGPGALGEERLARDLRRRGIDPDLARAALAEALGSADPLARAVDLARSRLGRSQGLGRQQAYRRLGAFLARRGFDGETIARALRQVLAAADEGEG